MSGELGFLILVEGIAVGLPCEQMLERLIHLPLFQDLTAGQFDLLEPLLEPYACAPGTMIINQGGNATHLYLILRGKVAIQYKPYDGPMITLTHLAEGDGFGWSSVIGNPSYTSDIVAQENVEAIRIRGDELRRLCLSHPDTGRIILDRLAQVVSSRWKNARAQVNLIFQQSLSVSDNKAKGGNKVVSPAYTEEQRIRGLIEQISAYIEQYHSGSVEFVSLDDGKLTVKLGGACIGCPLSPTTLHGWVAGTIHQFFPHIEVVAVAHE
jgi:Fe-S cluster biogenesis protein NfuA